MTDIADLATPALLLDLDKLERNLRRMAEKTRLAGVRLRPHIKTHKCVEVAQRQVEAGSSGLTVSTLYEAEVLADHGFDDLVWAFPLILNRIDSVCRLADRCRFGVVVDSSEAVTALEATSYPLGVWLKVDCGYHRAGVDPERDSASRLARRVAESPSLQFQGLLTHSGHAYKADSRNQLRRVAEQECSVMVTFAERLRADGIEVPSVSIGSTPAMSVVESLDGIDEARPGNYVFYDQTQVELGACDITDCAVTVLSSVVSCQQGSDHAVIDAGALALSKDSGREASPPAVMGRVFENYPEATLSRAHRVYGLSQEHGLVSGSLEIGSRIRILPNHSCLTVACFDEYHVVRDDRVVDRWKIWRGR